MVLSLVTTFTTTMRDVILFPFDMETKDPYAPRNEEEIELPTLNIYILDGKHVILAQKIIIENDKYNAVH